MAHLLVDGGTDTVRITLVIQWCRDAAHAGCHIVDDLVDFRSTHTCVNMLLYVVKYRHIDLGTLLDSGDLVRILDQVSCRHTMSFLRKTRDLLIKCGMTGFIFLAAATPARIISSNFN